MNSVGIHDFEALEEVLGQVHGSQGAAETHGTLCGLGVTGGCVKPGEWMTYLLDGTDPDDPRVRECGVQLEGLYAAILAGLASGEMALQPLLPGDDESLDRRAAQLGKWCQGFLAGMGLGGLTGTSVMTEEVGEIIADLAEIAQVEFVAEDDRENGETAFAEIVEYVRVCVFLMNEELRSAAASATLQ